MTPSRHIVKRLVVTGSESTGKTTLATALARQFSAPLSTEFVREYAAARQGHIGVADHWPIARGQMQSEDEAITRGNLTGGPLVLHDTDLLSTVAYAHHYTGQCDAGLEQLARRRLADHYLLLDIDVPWIADGVRDREAQRAEVHALFEATLVRFGASYSLVHGTWDERVAFAVRTTAALLHHP